VDDDAEETIQKEIDIMKEARDCINVVNYFGVYMKDTTLLLVMEFCMGN